jgi:GT2 family glycosyltransferase
VPTSVVLPTFDRAAALRRTLPALLRLEEVEEVVAVDDGSTDHTPALLADAAAREPRLRVVTHRVNRGAPAARNAGADAATGDWVLFAEDDCRFPPDFARVLRQEAEAHGALAAGAPMVHPEGRPLAEALAAARARRAGDGGLDDVAGFPEATLVTPLIPAPALVRTELVRALRFDEGYAGNAYREETDFFLRAAAAGATVVLTPRTFFWEEGRFAGGQPRDAAAEWWTLRNNWRFLRRHEAWLRERGLIASATREQLAFCARRARRLSARRRG